MLQDSRVRSSRGRSGYKREALIDREANTLETHLASAGLHSVHQHCLRFPLAERTLMSQSPTAAIHRSFACLTSVFLSKAEQNTEFFY